MELNEAVFRDKLRNLNVSSTSIEGTSAWVCYHRAHANRIAAIWEDVFSRADDAKRLALLYLTNDIVQNSRRKGPEFAAEFFRVLPRALKHFLTRCDEPTRKSAMRVVRIWDERRVFGFGGRRVLQELLEGGAARPAAPSGHAEPGFFSPDDDAVKPLLNEVHTGTEAAEIAARHAADAAQALSALPAHDIMTSLDPTGVERVRSGLAAALQAAEAEALAAAAAAQSAAALSRALECRETAAQAAARQFRDRAAQLERALSAPRSPEAVGGPAPVAPPPIESNGAGSMFTPGGANTETAAAIVAGDAGEEYDPDDPF